MGIARFIRAIQNEVRNLKFYYNACRYHDFKDCDEEIARQHLGQALNYGRQMRARNLLNSRDQQVLSELESVSGVVQ